MAVAKHLDNIARGREFWNAWRQENERIRPVLTGARLDNRDFVGMNLVKVNLSGAVLNGTDFRDADLRYADLSGCDLREARFEGANVMLADLTGADLRGASGLGPEELEETVCDAETQFPHGS